MKKRTKIVGLNEICTVVNLQHFNYHILLTKQSYCDTVLTTQWAEKLVLCLIVRIFQARE